MSFAVIDPKFFFTMIDNDASYHMIRGEIFFLEPGMQPMNQAKYIE